MTTLSANKKLIYILIPFALTLGMALDIYLPSIPRISGSLSTSITMVQWTMSGFFLCFGIGQLFIGPISDQIGRKKTVFISLVLYTSGAIFAAVAPNIEILIFARAIQAFGACGTQISAFTIAKDSIKDKKTSEQIFTYLKGSMGFAPMVAPIIGAFIDHHFSWRASFYILALFGVMLMILDYKWLSESLEEDKRVKFGFGSISSYFIMLRNRRFISLSICTIASQAVLFSFLSLSPHIIITTLGYTNQFFALCFGINALTYTLASVVSARLLIKINAPACIMIGGSLMLLSGILLLTFIYFHKLNILLLMAPALLASSGTSFILGPATSMAIDPYKHITGTATALIGSLEAISAAFVGNMAIKFSNFDGSTLACIILLSGTMVMISCYTGAIYKTSTH